MEANGEQELGVWFGRELLPEILREGHFPTGRNPRIADCQFESTERGRDHFASSPYFLQLTVESDDEERKVFHLVVKFCSQDDDVVGSFRLDKQFRNEVTVYGKLLNQFREMLLRNPKGPTDLVDRIVGKCYYARFDEENVKKSLLIFTDERRNGYRTAESKIFLDYDHCAISMKQLGRFHAMSLAMKIRYPELLNSMRESLEESKSRFAWDEDNLEEVRKFYGVTNQRGIEYLLLNPSKVPKDYLIGFKKLLSDPVGQFVRVTKPKEPLALLCHGDFCRNNLLFRYEGGRVADMKMFDFQLTRYANPSTDLALLIYLNTTQEIRDKHLDEFLEIYHSSLISTTAEILDSPVTEISDRYPFKLFADDFAEHALFGYMITSFFLPVMVAEQKPDFSMTTEEQASLLYSIGGEEISGKIADIIFDFYRRGFYVS